MPLKNDHPSASRSTLASLTTVPAPIKRLFDKFPLVTYAANDLPSRAPRKRQRHQLYIFTTEEGSLAGEPSFNPSCLRWQAYLRFNGVEFDTVSSSNHASPSGALPFLLPGAIDPDNGFGPSQPRVVPSDKLRGWAAENGSTAVKEHGDDRFEAYMALLDHDVRRAWLYALYLTSHFDNIAQPLYIDRTTTNVIVRASLARELRAAALAELLKHGTVVDGETIYSAAEDALRALDSLIGTDEWFFGAARPGLLDASVFAYTHLLLFAQGPSGTNGRWSRSRLGGAVRARPRLVRHQKRILDAFFDGAKNVVLRDEG